MKLSKTLTLAISIVLSACSVADANPTSSLDFEAVRKLIKEDLPMSFAGMPQNTETMPAILTSDVEHKWIKKQETGADNFVKVISNAFIEDNRRFVTAVINYKFLVSKCGLNDESQRPVGLPASVDLASFDPENLTPEIIVANPGLGFPYLKTIKDLQGTDFASNRFLIIAEFKHNWMKNSDPAYLFVDRFVVREEAGKLKIAEYEFTADLNDLPAFPEPTTVCP